MNSENVVFSFATRSSEGIIMGMAVSKSGDPGIPFITTL
jgi:hypothetical protein